jgi:hypothetical protein
MKTIFFLSTLTVFSHISPTADYESKSVLYRLAAVVEAAAKSFISSLSVNNSLLSIKLLPTSPPRSDPCSPYKVHRFGG